MNTLRNQILVLAAGLVLFAASLTLTTVWLSASGYIRHQVNQSLTRAAHLVETTLEGRKALLRSAAEVLTTDFGFRQAVATGDLATIGSVLENHGERIGADMMLLTDLQGRVTLTSIAAGRVETLAPLPDGLASTVLRDGVGTVYLNQSGRLYQVIILPVRAPRPVALTGIGFRLDERFAAEVRSLTQLEVTLIHGNGTRVDPLYSTLSGAALAEALSAPEELQGSFRLPFAPGQAFLSRRITLQDAAGNQAGLLVSASLDEAFREFDALRDRILLLTFGIIVAAVAGSVVLANSLGAPLARLQAVAREIAAGSFQQVPDISSRAREIRGLFQAFLTMRDEIRAREVHILHQATHDTLTQLLNRPTLLSRLKTLLVWPGHPVLVASINIRRFKQVNDTFGPAVGDELLRAVARQLRSLGGPNDLFARAGADEFLAALVIPEGMTSEQRVAALQRGLSEPQALGDLTLQPEFRIGLSLFPDDGETSETLLRRAGIAVEQARSLESGVHFYQRGEEEQYLERLALTRDLKAALAAPAGQLRMVYQPKLNLQTNTIDQCEALIRWIHPTRGFVPPDVFVELAEQSGLIGALTDFVVRTVITQIADWREQGLALQVAINVSAQDLERDNLVPDVLQQLGAHRLPPEAIHFELTERDLMNDPEKAIRLLSRCTEHGITLSIDDFGVGQSSLSKLKQMPVSALKIDKSFVLPLDSSESDRIIVASTIELGHRFQLKVIAEGVETAESLACLRDMGCDAIQGYFLARPMAPGDLQAWMAQRQENAA